MAGNVVTLTDANFQNEVLDSQEPVLVDFWAPWCGPCKAIAPALDELATRYKGKMKVAKLNVDENQETAQSYGIRSIPMLLVFKGGKVVDQILGAVPQSRLEESFTKRSPLQTGRRPARGDYVANRQGSAADVTFMSSQDKAAPTPGASAEVSDRERGAP